ncbi:BTAD domain-containing putative transcriptional regulator [Microbispora siamensis]
MQALSGRRGAAATDSGVHIGAPLPDGPRSSPSADVAAAPPPTTRLLLHAAPGIRTRSSVVTMEFRILGPLEVVGDDGAAVDLGGRRPRAVLARLLVAQGAVVSVHTLIDDVYGERAPASALPTLRSYISNLRRVIEPTRPSGAPHRLLVRRFSGYVLDATDVDRNRFVELVKRSEFASPGEALTCLDEALGLWRGTPYGEFADELWAVAEVSQLCETRLVAVERRAQALLDLGRPQAVIHDLETETAVNPLRERLWCLLALALYRSGRQAQALAAIRHVTTLLADQLGLDPGPELRTLERDILLQVDTLEPVIAAPSLLSAPSTTPRRTPHGRETQLTDLTTLATKPSSHAVRLAAVSGEPGIGKTCLLEAFRDQCADLGYLVLWGRCDDTEAAPPLWPWLQVLDRLAQHCPPPDPDALAGLLQGHSHEESAAEALRRRNLAVTRWLITAARAQPLVVVLDDLHWADSASLELLRDVVMLGGGLADGAALTVVVAHREAGFQRTAPHDRAAGAHGLSADDLLGCLVHYGLLRLQLGGVSAADVRAVAAEMGANVDEPGACRLTERTAGNPFFIRECLRLLLQGHTLDAVPGAVVDVVRQRIEALGPRVGEVLQIAAVVGRDFDPAVVAEVSRAEVCDLLDRAAQAGVLVVHGARMAFAHDLVRETLVGRVPPLRKAAIHREAMAVLASRPGTDVAVIAHHAVQAGSAAYGEAVRWARAAAEQAGLRLAYEEAATWWDRAIKAHDASAGDPGTHVELLLRQVRALLEAGDAIGARRARTRALLVAGRAEGLEDLTARALTALDAPALWTLRDPYEAVESQLVYQFETALRDLPAADSPLRVRLLGGLAQELYDGTDDPRRHVLSAEAVRMARRLGDPHLLMWALNARQLSLPQPLHTAELLEIGDELKELARCTRTPGFELLAHMIHKHQRLEMFDVAGADRAAAHCDALLERLELPWPRFQHTLWRGARLALAGRFDDAEAAYEEAARQARRIGMWYAQAVVAAGRLMLRYHQGAMSDAGPLIDALAGIHPTLDHDARVLQLCAQDRLDEAERTTVSGWPTPPVDWSWLTMTCLQGAAQAAVGDAGACHHSYRKLLPYSGRITFGSAIAALGPVDWFLALLASAVGDRQAAARHLSTLRQLADRNGLEWWRDRTPMAAGLPALHSLEAPLREPSGPSIGHQILQRGANSAHA